MKFLVITGRKEDSVVLSTLLRETYTVCEERIAQTGDEGLGLARDFQPDVIFLDFEMPEMGDVHVCQRLKADPACFHIPVLLLIGRDADAASRVRALELDCDASLGKPVEAFELAAQMRALLRSKQSFDLVRRENKALERRAARLTAINNRLMQKQALLINRDQYRVLFESSRDAILLLDRKGFLDCNKTAMEMFGLATKEEILWKHPSELSPAQQPGGGDSRKLADERTEAAFSQGSQFFEWLHKRADGTPFFVEVLLSRIDLPEKPLLQAVVRDITERKRAEQALRESEEWFRLLFKCGNDAIFVFRLGPNLLNERYIEVNDMACARLGYTREELLQLTLGQINAVENLESIKEYLRILQVGRHVTFETVHLTKDKRRISVEANVNLFELDGQPTLISIARDITERKALEEQLRQTQKLDAIGQLAGGVAHDFNNILAATLMRLGIMERDTTLPAHIQTSLRELESYTNRASNLARQLLTFSRRQVIQMKKIDLNEVVRLLIKMLDR
ncbi:MAG: PAS domain S-box protein, partial [Opitutaceae bacterium]